MLRLRYSSLQSSNLNGMYDLPVFKMDLVLFVKMENIFFNTSHRCEGSYVGLTFWWSCAFSFSDSNRPIPNVMLKSYHTTCEKRTITLKDVTLFCDKSLFVISANFLLFVENSP